MNKVSGLILAGGKGTRFWPKSRINTPKQLLPILGKNALVKECFELLGKFIEKDNIFVSTNVELKKQIKKVIPEIRYSNIICEPIGRNTAPAIGLSAIIIRDYFRSLKKCLYKNLTLNSPEENQEDIVLVVIPGDHYIENKHKFINILKEAVKYSSTHEEIVTLGIKPTYAETGYGYIKIKNNKSNIKNQELRIKHYNSKVKNKKVETENFKPESPFEFFEVESFTEKPDEKKAQLFLKSGKYLWNGGIFIAKISTFLSAIQEHSPEIYEKLMLIDNELITENFIGKEELVRIFSSMPNVSLDYAVMEKAKNVVTIFTDVGWSDIGSWKAVYDLKMKSKQNKKEAKNIIEGRGKKKCILINTKDCFIQSRDKLIATVGVKDLVIIEEKDAILICNKDCSQDVKKVVESIEAKGLKKYL